MWVGFLYTLVARVLSGFWMMSTSRKASWAFDSLYCKLDCGFYGVEVADEVVYVASFEGTTGVIYISFPELGWLGVCGRGS